MQLKKEVLWSGTLYTRSAQLVTYVARATQAKSGLRAGNIKFNTQN
jgi:hypothetical protein